LVSGHAASIAAMLAASADRRAPLSARTMSAARRQWQNTDPGSSASTRSTSAKASPRCVSSMSSARSQCRSELVSAVAVAGAAARRAWCCGKVFALTAVVMIVTIVQLVHVLRPGPIAFALRALA
jgi:hypothetical protein